MGAKENKSSIDLQKSVCVKIKNELENKNPFKKHYQNHKSVADHQNNNIEKFARDLKIS